MRSLTLLFIIFCSKTSFNKIPSLRCYMRDGEIDTTQEGKDSVLTDISLQYEAMHWAKKFNKTNPPKKIDFIRAYAVEFVDRPGKPMFAVERFIAGKDSYGLGFIKHNTNSGMLYLYPIYCFSIYIPE